MKQSTGNCRICRDPDIERINIEGLKIRGYKPAYRHLVELGYDFPYDMVWRHFKNHLGSTSKENLDQVIDEKVTVTKEQMLQLFVAKGFSKADEVSPAVAVRAATLQHKIETETRKEDLFRRFLDEVAVGGLNRAIKGKTAKKALTEEQRNSLMEGLKKGELKLEPLENGKE